tara:strand:+ start:970 stop:2106 length:1137 start_codon:yes stop_codon:yes gene_type:complete
MKKNLKFIGDISSLKESQYNKLITEHDSPFIKYSFLSSLEKSGCVSQITGWKSNHLVDLNNNNIEGFLPLYIKDNSQGEFIFDHSWSYALNRTGRKYYPKLLSAIPFTPCETRKIISSEKYETYINKVTSFMRDENIETWHILFPDRKLAGSLMENGFIERYGYKFIWKNKNYSNFEDYLNIFKSRQRKNIKNERKKIAELDIDFEIKDMGNLTNKDWDDFYVFYKNTYEQRLQRPYLNPKFFKYVHECRSDLRPVIFFAIHKNKKIAGSLCYQGNDTLYGRHWGSLYDIDSLHFETCYYQGIEYCINNKIQNFDPGVQGEHKIRRGFEPQRTSSFHFIKEMDFKSAISDFCIQEKKEIDRYLQECERYTPFKKEYKI